MVDRAAAFYDAFYASLCFSLSSRASLTQYSTCSRGRRRLEKSKKIFQRGWLEALEIANSSSKKKKKRNSSCLDLNNNNNNNNRWLLGPLTPAAAARSSPPRRQQLLLLLRPPGPPSNSPWHTAAAAAVLPAAPLPASSRFPRKYRRQKAGDAPSWSPLRTLPHSAPTPTSSRPSSS